VVRIFCDGLADRSSLSEDEQRRFDPHDSVFMFGLNQEYQFTRTGVIAPSIWVARMRGPGCKFRRPGMQNWRSECRQVQGQDFAELVENLIREEAAAG
jgi:hypothetical protein